MAAPVGIQSGLPAGQSLLGHVAVLLHSAAAPSSTNSLLLLMQTCQAGSQGAADYAQLVQETSDSLHAAVPGSSVSVDIPWSPYDVDGRNYDWLKLATAADVLFVMAYDTQSQVSLCGHYV